MSGDVKQRLAAILAAHVAGDSVLAVFETATGAVTAELTIQAEIN